MKSRLPFQAGDGAAAEGAALIRTDATADVFVHPRSYS